MGPRARVRGGGELEDVDVPLAPGDAERRRGPGSRTAGAAARGSVASKAGRTAVLITSCSAGAGKERSAAAPQRPAASAEARAAAARTPAPSLQSFWASLRKAALAGDTDAVAALTRFPFKTRGELDGEPWVQHGREGFPAVFSRLLQQDTGLAAEEEPLRRLIERTPSLQEGAAGSARLAALVFELVDGRWMLTAAYLAE